MSRQKKERDLLACWKVMREFDGNRWFVWNYFLDCTVVVSRGSNPWRVANALNRIYWDG